MNRRVLLNVIFIFALILTFKINGSHGSVNEKQDYSTQSDSSSSGDRGLQPASGADASNGENEGHLKEEDEYVMEGTGGGEMGDEVHEKEDKESNTEDRESETNGKGEAMESETDGKGETMESETDGKGEAMESETDGKGEAMESETDGKGEARESETDGKGEARESETDGKGEARESRVDETNEKKEQTETEHGQSESNAENEDYESTEITLGEDESGESQRRKDISVETERTRDEVPDDNLNIATDYDDVRTSVMEKMYKLDYKLKVLRRMLKDDKKMLVQLHALGYLTENIKQQIVRDVTALNDTVRMETENASELNRLQSMHDSHVDKKLDFMKHEHILAVND